MTGRQSRVWTQWIYLFLSTITFAMIIGYASSVDSGNIASTVSAFRFR